jgi:hypothetical protein
MYDAVRVGNCDRSLFARGKTTVVLNVCQQILFCEKDDKSDEIWAIFHLMFSRE